MSKLRPTILVIEDDPAVRQFLRVTLDGKGYRVLEASRGEEGLRHASVGQPDLIILDLGLPDLDGTAVTRSLRKWTSTPIIVISARGREEDKIQALDLGADDYLTKPFGVGELLARMRVALRHLASANPDTGDPVFRVGDLAIDLASRVVLLKGTAVQLTPTEFRLLSALVKNAGRVMTHKTLLRDVWGPGSVHDTHYLRVYMNQLRQKLEDDPSQPKYFITETGVGYRLTIDTREEPLEESLAPKPEDPSSRTDAGDRP